MVNARYEKWICGVSAALLLSAALSGCANNPGDTQGNLKNYSGPVKVKTLEQTQKEERSAQSVVPVTQIHNTGYVPLDAVARAIGFHSEWLDDGKYGVGDSDAAWSFRPGDSNVDTGESTDRMPAPAVKQNNRLYVPVSALHILFGDAASFRAEDKQVSFYPRVDVKGSGADDLALPFRDDPNAGQGGLKAESQGQAGQLPGGGQQSGTGALGGGAVGGILGGILGQIGNGQMGNGQMPNGAAGNQAQNGQIPYDPTQNGQTGYNPAQNGQLGNGQSDIDQSLGGNYRLQSSRSSGDHSDVIREARKYLGIRYDFGAGSYSKTHKFDCSSYTQNIFGKFGVSLPRTAREQGRMGQSVSRSNLQKGDLVFFSVPGRFKSDSTVGHVGIYMGNGDMINANSAPEDGVQITDINKEYWRDQFLFAKRIL